MEQHHQRLGAPTEMVWCDHVAKALGEWKVKNSIGLQNSKLNHNRFETALYERKKSNAKSLMIHAPPFDRKRIGGGKLRLS